MAHESNILHSIKLPNGTTYEIHDAQAVHTLADIEALGLSGAFVYKGTKASVTALPSTGNKVGDVYHVTENNSEYVWTTDSKWEEFGHHMVVEHTHEVTAAGTNKASAVTGSATVTGGNSSSAVSGSASITNAPKVTETAVYAKVDTGTDTFVKSYPGTTSKMVTTSVTPAGTATDVIASVTPTTGSITGVSGSVTASKATAGENVEVAKAGADVTVATGLNAGSVTAGKSASWSATVDGGVLSFSWTTNDPTAVTLPTAKTTTIKPAVANGSITPYTFDNVTVPKAATSATTVVTGVSTTDTSVATVGSAVTVATGALASNGAGSSVMTGLGTATTGSALKSANLVAGTSTDGLHTGDDVTITTQTLSGTISGTAAAQTWTQNTGTISGTAAAQEWTGSKVETSDPIAE